MKTSSIYVDLESLLDMRQAFLIQNVGDKKSLTDYLLGDDYNLRETDVFNKWTILDYRDEFNKAEKYLLENSTMTRILLSIKLKITNIENRNKYYNETTVPEVVVNTYPFEFDEETNEQLRNAIFVRLDSDCLIRMVCSNIKEISPINLRDGGYISAFIYNSSDWFKHHADALVNISLRDTILYFPCIYSAVPTEEDMKTIVKMGFKDPAGYMEFLYSSVVSMNFLPQVYYSNIATALRYDKYTSKEIKKGFKDIDIGDIDGDILSKIQVP